MLAEQEAELEAVTVLANRLVSRLGDFESSARDSVWVGPNGHSLSLDRPEPAEGSTGRVHSSHLDDGLLPMLTLLITAPEVAAFHASRDIPPVISIATLADLGQQVWVHRLTYGRFGLHAHGWLTIAWSGALYAVGRLQFNLEREPRGGERDGVWVLSTHIPRTGPLDPASVDASLAAATTFFATHFPDYPTQDFICSSWLLDPELAIRLPGSNLAAFQRRWTLSGDPQPGDDDLLFFVFNRRGPADLATLPTDTSLRRAYIDRRRSGESWSTLTGRMAQTSDPLRRLGPSAEGAR